MLNWAILVFKTWRQQDRNQLKTDNSADGTESFKKETYTFCWPKVLKVTLYVYIKLFII
jgi:hypothetical protein